MASELLKTKALAARIKEPKVRDFDFGLNLTSVESLIPDLPEPKPQELLDIQEDNRKGRLLESLNKIGGRLEDTSLDFIKRKEFNQGNFAKKPGFGTPVGTYPKTSPADLKKIRDYLKSLPKGSNVGLQTLQKQTGVDRGTIRLIVQREFPNLNIGGTAAQSENMKKVNEERKAKGFRSGVKMEEYTKDYSKKFQFPKGSKFSDAMSNEDLAIKYFGEASKKNLARVERINTDLRKELKLEYPKGDPNKGYIVREERKKKFTSSADDKYILNKQKAQKKLLNTYFKNNPEEILKKPKVLQMINAKLKDGKLDFSPRYDSEKKYIDLAKEGKLFDEFDIIPIRSEKRGIMYPVNKTITPGKFNQAFIKQVDAYYKKTKGSKDAEVLANKETIDNYLKQIGVRVDAEGVRIGESVLPAIDRKTGALPNIENTLKKLDLNNLIQKDITPTDADNKSIAKKLASFGFKCSAAEGGACDNPMAYLDDIKKQQAIAKGSGNAAANAAKKLSAGKTIMREFIGPAALGFELAAAVPITYLGYKAGLPPARIVSDATYGLFGDTEKARLKKEAVKAGIDTSEIQKSLDFEKASGAMQTLAQQEGEFRGPDDEMLFPQQYEKGEEDFYKAVGAFRDKAGNISKDVYQKFGSQLQQLRDYIAQTDAATAAERSSRVADFGGIDEFLNYNSGGRVNYSNGSDGTDLAIKESLEAFERYLKAGGKLSYKDFIAVGNEGVSKFFNSGGRVGFADGPDNPKRRQFMKIMAGIASLPIVGKFFKGAKSAKVVKLANTTTVMPDWFPAFVDKAFEKGIAKKIDADLTEIEIPELPGVKVQAHDDGRIMVEGKNAYNEPYEINYTPPGYELVDETTGKAVKTPGEFQASDTRFRQVGPELDDVDVDYDTVPDIEDIVGGNSTELEGFAKGTGETKYTKGQKAVDEADARSQYSEQERADFDQGPEIDPTDYTYED